MTLASPLRLVSSFRFRASGELSGICRSRDSSSYCPLEQVLRAAREGLQALPVGVGVLLQGVPHLLFAGGGGAEAERQDGAVRHQVAQHVLVGRDVAAAGAQPVGGGADDGGQVRGADGGEFLGRIADPVTPSTRAGWLRDVIA
nr:hypothetical protein [Streptomyces sp. NRRL B-24484]